MGVHNNKKPKPAEKYKRISERVKNATEAKNAGLK
jgi:hypothetical protein